MRRRGTNEVAFALLAGTAVAVALPARAQPLVPVEASPAAVALDELAVEGLGRGALRLEPQGGVTVGYLGKATRSATKTPTPLLDTPQSVSVITREQILDQGFQSIGEATRYVPGVIQAQGEGNRDELIIRGQRSNADFFVNGIRDDVQYYRDLYNIQRIEVLKGPNAMIFGRGGGGGVINRACSRKPTASRPARSSPRAASSRTSVWRSMSATASPTACSFV